MKYITIQNNQGDVFVATFSEELIHREMAKGMLNSMSGVKLRSAGFYYFQNGKVVVPNQHSQSLNLGPKEGDVSHLANHLNGFTTLDIRNIEALATFKLLGK